MQYFPLIYDPSRLCRVAFDQGASFQESIQSADTPWVAFLGARDG